MWGSPESVQEVKALVELIEGVQKQQAAVGGGGVIDRTPFVGASSREVVSPQT
jgi:hypothetical protein